MLALAAAILAMLVLVAVLGFKLIRLYGTVKDPSMPKAAQFVFWGAIAWLISPIDPLPDPILIDDLGVLIFAVRYLEKQAREYGIEPSARSSLPERRVISSTAEPKINRQLNEQ